MLATMTMPSNIVQTWNIVVSAQEESESSAGDMVMGNDAHRNSMADSKIPCGPEEGSEYMKDYEGPDTRFQSVTNGTVYCVDGMAGDTGFPCDKVDLVSHLTLADLGGASAGNDIWGWVSPTTDREYAIMGTYDGMAFVDITDAEMPKFLGRLPANYEGSSWFDMKVYQDHVFVVSEGSRSGMQVFDLTVLDDMTEENEGPDLFLKPTAQYDEFDTAHNIAINEETGYAYVVGSDRLVIGFSKCRSGLHMVDISTPAEPVYAGCYRGDGYVHDAQCVVYDGPHERFVGKEICFCCNEDTVTMVDVTNKSFPRKISKFRYRSTWIFKLSYWATLGTFPFAYTHQGWLTEDHKYFIFDDEMDHGNTRTFVMDIQSLTRPKMRKVYCADFNSPDHNLYVVGHYVYQANYRAGFRILDIANLLDDTRNNDDELLKEVAFFDIYPNNNGWFFNGAWGNYPYFPSQNIVVSGIEQGIFVVRPHISYNSTVRVRDLQVNYHALDVPDVADEEKDAIDNNNYYLSVTITVHDHSSIPVGGATVTGIFFQDSDNHSHGKEELLKTNQQTCVTDISTGRCDIVMRKKEGQQQEHFHFDVVHVMLPRHRYESEDNEYSSITVNISSGEHEKHKEPKLKKQTKTTLWDYTKTIAKGLAGS